MGIRGEGSGGQEGREVGEKGEGSRGKRGGKWGMPTPLSTPHKLMLPNASSDLTHLCRMDSSTTTLWIGQFSTTG